MGQTESAEAAVTSTPTSKPKPPPQVTTLIPLPSNLFSQKLQLMETKAKTQSLLMLKLRKLWNALALLTCELVPVVLSSQTPSSVFSRVLLKKRARTVYIHLLLCRAVSRPIQMHSLKTF